MKAGVIGEIEGTIDNFDNYYETRSDRDFDLRKQLEFSSSHTTGSGISFYSGRAAVERLDENDNIDFNENGIIVTQGLEKTQYYTEFLVVPDDFVVITSSSGEFAFNVLETENQVSIKKAEIDMFGLLDSTEEYNPTPWQVGFYDKGGDANKGVIYGADILSDKDIGNVLKNSKMNQLGLELEAKDGISIKFSITESGYVEVYQPSNYESADFIEFIDKYISSNYI